MRSFSIIWIALAVVACTKADDTDETDTETDTDTDSDTDTDEPREACEDDVCIVEGTILADRTFHAYNRYLLRGPVTVGEDRTTNVTLTIEPGTEIFGESSTGGFLLVTRGSRLVADGTADQPIVFTSSQAPGDRARGDWGGLILNGEAPINRCPETGPCEAEGEGGTGLYGGTDPHDDSGVLRHVIVEFGGFQFTPDNELNCIAFQGVGDGTTVEFVQTHMGADDGMEFFGGTVNVKHVVITGALDDSLDWTDGWSGKVQHVVIQQYEDAADNGFEADNQKTNKDAEPRSNPTIDHVTIVGSPENVLSNNGMLLREGTDATITNAIVTGFHTSCIDIDGDVTWGRADGGTLQLSRSIVSCATNFAEDEEGRSVEGWFTGQSGNQVADPKLKKPLDTASPSFAPDTGSPALTGGQSPSDAFFDEATYIGGVDPASDWTAGWIHTARN